MKSISLICKLILSLSLILLSESCTKEECFDFKQLESLEQEMQEWYIDTTQLDFIIEDRNGIRQNMFISSSHYNYFHESNYDDCGGVYGSHSFMIDYGTSISPLFFYVNIFGSAFDDGFKIELRAQKTGVYSLNKDAGISSSADIRLLDEVEVKGKVYKDVLKFTFLHTQQPNEVKVVYLAKKYGIIKFVNHNGNEFGRI